MTSTTPAPPAGWYPDSDPGRLRWFDGNGWTADTMPVPQRPAAQAARTDGPAPAPAGVPLPHAMPTSAPPVLAGDPVTGRRSGIGMSWWSVAAVFLAVLTLVLWGLTLVTGLVGIAAIAREKRQGTGQVVYGGLAIGAAVAGRVLARATEQPTLLAWL